MATVRIEFETDNAAFTDNPGEYAAVLEQAMGALERGQENGVRRQHVVLRGQENGVRRQHVVLRGQENGGRRQDVVLRGQENGVRRQHVVLRDSNGNTVGRVEVTDGTLSSRDSIAGYYRRQYNLP